MVNEKVVMTDCAFVDSLDRNVFVYDSSHLSSLYE